MTASGHRQVAADPDADQRAHALAVANARREEQARLRRAFLDGSMTLADVVEQRPAALASLTLFEILLKLRGVGRSTVIQINRQAIRDHVNLAMTVERASDRTLEWLVAALEEHGRVHSR